MPALSERLGGLQSTLDEASQKYRVPGASLAVALGDEQVELATGVVNARTGVETTTDAVFQIGSITKLFTTTLVMQLVDEGKVDLDTPVRRYLPELGFGDLTATETVTLRHLVTHTSGIDGDYFLDTGRGDDCVERYVLACGALPQIHAVGARFSYCNAGFVVAGRVIERLTGLTWDNALRERILRPIGADTMATLPEEAILYRAAAGHFPGPDGGQRVAPLWMLPRSNGPAGATPFAAARDLIKFARMHLAGGKAPDGTRVLSQASVTAMQQTQVDLPGLAGAAHWGLGWMLFDWGGQRVIGHDGGTIGQFSFLRIHPASGLTVALLTNGGNAQALSRRILGEVFGELAGIALPPLEEPTPGLELDPAPYLGSYQKLSARVDVALMEGQLTATMHQLKALVPGLPPQVVTLKPIDSANFVAEPIQGGPRQVFTFSDFGPDGHPEHVMLGRLHRRVR